MRGETVKLTAYLGERDRVGHRFAADAVLDVCERHAVAISVLLRGSEGFGARHRLRTERSLTLSEDLPLVAVAVDARPRIEAVRREVAALHAPGLLTLERARLAGGPAAPSPGEAKLTVFLGRQARVGGRPAHVALTDLLRDHGVAGATTLLGVDGTLAGERRRARFLARNSEVPSMLVSVGDGERLATALPACARALERPLLTLERVRVLKRDGRALAALEPPPEAGPWQKLTVYAGEEARHGGEPLHRSLLRRLRREGAAGATALRGVWGYHGDHPPHGDALLALRRRVPMVTVIVDAPEPMARWWPIVDEHTRATGLVTSEWVPVLASP